MENSKFDTIVIGSGPGGLSSASILAQAGQRVLLLERHYIFGGFTHEFSRKGKYSWTSGLHYIGQMQAEHPFRMVMDYVTGGKINFHPMPDDYDHFVFPDFEWKVCSGTKNYKAQLMKMFPKQSAAITKYFADLKKAELWTVLYVARNSFPPFMRFLPSMIMSRNNDLALQSTQEYLDKNFTDDKLKAVLVAQIGNVGMRPTHCSFGLHSIIVGHFLEGAFKVSGGSQNVADSAVELIRAHGGVCMANAGANKIIMENGAAVGVEVHVKKGKEVKVEKFYAKNIVSSTGFEHTFKRLLEPNVVPQLSSKIDDLISKSPRFSAASLVFGLKGDPRKLGVNGSNYWIKDNYECRDSTPERVLEKNIFDNLFVAFPSLNDPEAKTHTVEALIGCDYEFFKEWADQPCQKRDDNYYDLKTRMAEAVEARIERMFPGFKELVDFRDFSTPLTIEHYSNRARGDAYGLIATGERFKQDWITPETPVPGLYITGQDIAVHGIAPSIMSGLSTSAQILGSFGAFKIFGRVFFTKWKSSRKEASKKKAAPESKPDELRKAS